MAGKKNRSPIGISVWGIFLLFIGIIFLLQTLNVISWDLWATLWRFWPVLIIIAGISILMRRFNPWLVSVLALLLLGVCFGLAVLQHDRIEQEEGVSTREYSLNLDKLESAEIIMDLSAANINVAGLPADSSNLVEADFRGKGNLENLDINFERDGSEGSLYLDTKNYHFYFGDDFDAGIFLSPEIPMVFNVEASACNLDFDLTELNISELDMDLSACNCVLKISDDVEEIFGEVSASAANVEIYIPEDTAAKILVGGSMTSIEIDTSRFTKTGEGYYESDGFDRADNRVELKLDCSLGRIEVQ